MPRKGISFGIATDYAVHTDSRERKRKKEEEE
jgi:hypothetical protein